MRDGSWAQEPSSEHLRREEARWVLVPMGEAARWWESEAHRELAAALEVPFAQSPTAQMAAHLQPSR